VKTEWKGSIFSSKTSVLVWCGLKQAENKLKTTPVSEQCLSPAENAHIQKRSYWAGFEAENDPFKNPSTGLHFYQTLGFIYVIKAKKELWIWIKMRIRIRIQIQGLKKIRIRI